MSVILQKHIYETDIDNHCSDFVHHRMQQRADKFLEQSLLRHNRGCHRPLFTDFRTVGFTDRSFRQRTGYQRHTSPITDIRLDRNTDDKISMRKNTPASCTVHWSSLPLIRKNIPRSIYMYHTRSTVQSALFIKKTVAI